jgi:hypothetical protein
MSDLFGQAESRIKQIGSASVLLYVAGFIVRRAQLSVLGVTVSLPLNDQVYFVAGAVFLGFTAYALMVSLPVVAAGGAIAWALSRALRQRLLLGRIVAGALLVASALCAKREYQSVLSLRAVPFSPAAANDWKVQDLAAGGNECWILYIELVLLAAVSSASLFFVWRDSGQSPDAQRLVRSAAGLVWGVQLLMLPAAFGVLAQGVSYPVVDASGVPGLVGREAVLLLETDKLLVLEELGCGRVVTVDRSEVHQWATTRMVNVFNVIREKKDEHAVASDTSGAGPCAGFGDRAGTPAAGGGSARRDAAADAGAGP